MFKESASIGHILPMPIPIPPKIADTCRCRLIGTSLASSKVDTFAVLLLVCGWKAQLLRFLSFAVYLKLPWFGKIPLNFEKQTKTAVNRCYQAVEPRIIFETKKNFLQLLKMIYPPFNKVWLYINTCAAVAVGTWVEFPQDCRTELINTFREAKEVNTFREAKEVTKDLGKICLIENAKSLAPLVSTVILQSYSIY